MVSNGHACHHAMRNFTTFKVHSGGGRQEQKKKKKERQVWRKFHDLASHVGSSNFYLVKHLVIPELGYFV